MRRRFARSPIGLLIACALALMGNVTGCQVGGAPPAMLHAGSDGAGIADVSNVSDTARSSPTPLNDVLPVDPAIQKLLNSVQSDQLLITVDTLASMRTRHVLSAGFDPAQGVGISAARDFLLAQFHAIRSVVPLIIWTQPVTVTVGGVTATTYNVVAIAQGTDPNAGVIVVGAHYDSVNADDFNSADLPAPGANDNGSGVAALLDVARLLTQSGPPRTTLLFVAFTAEETGRQGSLTFVQRYLQAQNPPIIPRAMINLDTIGGNQTSNDQPGADALRIFSADPNNSPSRQLARQVQLAASDYLTSPQVIVQSSGERAGHFGDQQSFSAAGDAAIRLNESAEDPARQRSAQDTLDDIQPRYLMAATRAALAILAVLADGPDAPQAMTWQASDATLSWSPIKGASGYVVALRQAESASFDRTITVSADPIFQWQGLTAYAFAAVAAFDGRGRMGPLSPEIALTR